MLTVHSTCPITHRWHRPAAGRGIVPAGGDRPRMINVPDATSIATIYCSKRIAKTSC